MRQVATGMLAIITGIGVITFLIGGVQIAIGFHAMVSNDTTSMNEIVGRGFAFRGVVVAVVGLVVCAITSFGRRRLCA